MPALLRDLGKMYVYNLVALTVGLFHIRQTHAWGFYFLRESGVPGRHASSRVLEGVKRCTVIAQSGGTRPVGIEIDQFPETLSYPEQTEIEPWQRRATYIGFWAAKSCKGLPRLIIHAYDEQAIRMTFRWAQLAGLVEGFPATSVRFWSWGEIPEGDALWPGLIPEGAVAVKKNPSIFGYMEQDEYYVFENRLLVTDFGQEVVDLTVDSRWAGFGEGTGEPPTVVTLRGNDLTLPAAKRERASDDSRSRSQVVHDGQQADPVEVTASNQLEALRQSVDQGLLGGAPQNLQQRLSLASDNELRQISDALGISEQQYRQLRSNLQTQPQLLNDIADLSARAQNIINKVQDPEYYRAMIETLQALSRYWTQQLGYPQRVLEQMLESISPVTFGEILDQSYPDSLTIPEIAEFLRIKYFQDVGELTQAMAGMNPLEYAQAVMMQNQMQALTQNPGYGMQQQMVNPNMGQQGMLGSNMMMNPYLGQNQGSGQVYVLVPDEPLPEGMVQIGYIPMQIQNSYPGQNSGYLQLPQQQMSQQGGFPSMMQNPLQNQNYNFMQQQQPQNMMQNPFFGQLQGFPQQQQQIPQSDYNQQLIPQTYNNQQQNPFGQSLTPQQGQGPTDRRFQSELSAPVQATNQNIMLNLDNFNSFMPQDYLRYNRIVDPANQQVLPRPNDQPVHIPPFTYRDEDIVAQPGTYEFNEQLPKEEYADEIDWQSMEQLIEVPMSTPADSRNVNLAGHAQDVTDFVANYPSLLEGLVEERARRLPPGERRGFFSDEMLSGLTRIRPSGGAPLSLLRQLAAGGEAELGGQGLGMEEEVRDEVVDGEGGMAVIDPGSIKSEEELF
ncbi:hypothetical protein TWF696_004934 [Orbilia brochopaga]|uniref:Uncharacterized protein n=1 Tax=Orbilia brochopaga TaxID=3140254 RepID=A0AAV9V0G0_9PEZI